MRYDDVMICGIFQSAACWFCFDFSFFPFFYDKGGRSKES